MLTVMELSFWLRNMKVWGQIIMAFAVTHVKGLIYYLPFLLVSGLITGFIIGFLTKLLLPYLKKTILVKNGNPKKEE